MSIAHTMQERADEFVRRYHAVAEQIRRVIVGHDEIVHGVLTCLFVGGHCLLEGVPGLGKTLLVRTLARTLDLNFSRIQFTPDLMPADILGTNMVMEDPEGKRFFEFQRGPIFTQICLADEINRATPKTQSAMLETMQEGSVTVAGHQYVLGQAVLRAGHAKPDRAGRNLPAARGAARSILLQAGGRLFEPRRAWPRSSIARPRGESIEPEKVMDGPEIIRWQELIREVILADHVPRLHRAPDARHASGRSVRPADHEPISALGRQSRGAQTLALASKCGPCSEGATMSASRTSAASICPPCGIA